jgi:hypothetical protein
MFEQSLNEARRFAKGEHRLGKTPLRSATYNKLILVAGRNGVSSLHLVNLCFNIAYPVRERRFAVC